MPVQQILLSYGRRASVNQTPVVSFTPFVATISSGNTTPVTLGLVSGNTYNFTVSWGDGSSNTITTDTDPNAVHTYPTNSSYQLSVVGIMPQVHFINSTNIRRIDSWGDIVWTSLSSAFFRNTNLNFIASGGNFSQVLDCSRAFAYCHGLKDFPNLNLFKFLNFILIIIKIVPL